MYIYKSSKILYLSKQIKFRELVKDIQNSLNSREYIRLGYSFDNFVRMKWNISK